LFAAISLIGACGDSAVRHVEQTGELQLALRGTSSGGVEYRLRHGTFSITGASSATASTEDDLQAETINVELEVGDYAITLLPGWDLERASTEGGFVTVEASLTSANSQSFSIEAQQTSSVTFRFRVGGDIVVIGTGSVDIRIEVDDSSVTPDTPALLHDPINAGDSAQWTFHDVGGNPVVALEEVTSPYDGGTALQTVAVGTTYSACSTDYAVSKTYHLAEPVMSDAVALEMYIALDSDGTYYNWPWVSLTLRSGETELGYVFYYRLAATGGYRLNVEPMELYYAIPDNGYQRLPLAPIWNSDAGQSLVPSPVAFDSFEIVMLNYACVGTNKVVIDDISLTRLMN